MAKDDYYTLAAKILIYLYKKIKNEEDAEPDYLRPMTKDFPINEKYFAYIIEMLEKQKFIEVKITKAWGGDVIAIDAESMRILPAGIDYLRENKAMRRICETLKEAKAIFSLFQ